MIYYVIFLTRRSFFLESDHYNSNNTKNNDKTVVVVNTVLRITYGPTSMTYLVYNILTYNNVARYVFTHCHFHETFFHLCKFVYKKK